MEKLLVLGNTKYSRRRDSGNSLNEQQSYKG